VRRRRRLDESTHAISFRPRCLGATEWDAQKASRLKGWIESQNALRWRPGQLLGCAFTETKSSKIIIGKLGPRLRHAEAGLPVRRSRGRLHERPTRPSDLFESRSGPLAQGGAFRRVSHFSVGQPGVMLRYAREKCLGLQQLSRCDSDGGTIAPASTALPSFLFPLNPRHHRLLQNSACASAGADLGRTARRR
jgi:hypothetical protein